jgi:serine/threonine-protein kinase
VVHRDVKPENILLTGSTSVLTDFGIAQAVDSSGGRLTGTGLLIGSPGLHESGAGHGQVDQRSDVYALGCVLYEMLGGAPPFAGTTTIALLASHTNKAVTPLREVRGTVPLHLESVVLRALAKDPADRFGSAGDLAIALGRVVSGTGFVAAAPGADSRPRSGRSQYFHSRT